MEFLIVIEKGEDGDGYYAYCPDLSGCTSHGDTVEELTENMREAIKVHIELMKEAREEVLRSSGILLSVVSM
jgi:predicted RNase H-like HicB family nuclease